MQLHLTKADKRLSEILRRKSQDDTDNKGKESNYVDNNERVK